MRLRSNLTVGYFYKGKHRRRTRKIRDAVTVLGTTAVVYGSTALLSTPASAEPPGGWGPIIECESNGRNIENSGPSTASGYFQFTNGTWRRFGGTEFAPRAIQATFEEQLIVANRAFEANGLRDWNASRSCWGGKVRANATPASRVVGIPGTPQQVQPQSDSETYTVKSGDTLSGIAGSDWREVWKANIGVIGQNPHLIFPGQQLRV
jgi:hypothetical protein